jgi:exodeoxyribonuclease V gamma subunit
MRMLIETGQTMSVVYLASQLETLAARLADVLAERERSADFFNPATVVVPNRYLRKWLRLYLARRMGISINIRFLELNEALWELLRAVDPRKRTTPPEPLDANTERLLVLSVLLEDREPGLAVLRKYMQLQAPLPRLACRRAWHLADRLSRLISEYEFHRHETLIQPWLRGEPALREAAGIQHLMERAQRSLFARVADPEDGKRNRLCRLSGRNLATLPQYAAEVMAHSLSREHHDTIHVFGLTQVTAFHARVLAWLGRLFEIRLYHPNVIASRLHGMPVAGDLRGVVLTLSDENAHVDPNDPGRELLRGWGRAGSTALSLIAGLVEAGAFRAEVLEPVSTPGVKKTKPRTVLARLHDHLLGTPGPAARPLSQDTSVQIVSCPGIVREVETVHNSILDNLRRNPALRQTDFAVLVTDMARYRPILQAVFERPPHRLEYNLVDFSAAGLSTMGQALIGMLDLALESFTRSRVFAVLLNPCFLARLGIDRAQALTWLDWAETLGIYQGWDAGEKEEQGYARSPFYAWRLAVQRLRLGRYMEVAAEDADGPAPRFGHVIPFADIYSADREHLDAFCRSVETLLPALAGLRRLSGTGQRWATALTRLVHDFLDVPADRPEEEQVRSELLAALERLALWDHVVGPRATPDAHAGNLPLALVREYVQTQLEGLAGSRGEYLTGGVTIAALEPMRPVPFPVVYVLGLDAELFPGSNALSSFDLRGAHREPADIRPAEERAYLLLESLVAAQQKIYLLYNNYDVARDQTLLPSVPLQQLQRYLATHVTGGEFSTVPMPAQGADDAFFNEAQQPQYQDVLVQYRTADRFVALAAAVQDRRLALDLNQQAELRHEAETLKVDFAVVAAPPPATALSVTALPVTVSVAELRRFLQFPAREVLRRHLRIDDEEEAALETEEPLVTPDAAARQMVRQTLQQVLRRAMAGETSQALSEWRDRFRCVFADGRLRSRVPEDAFGAIDEAALQRELEERIHGKGGLEAFLRAHAGMMTCGPALLGESITPVGAKMRFPALRLPGDPEIRVVGSTPFAWFSRATFEILVVTAASKVNIGDVCQPMLEPLLLYLALLANPEPNHKAIAAKDWLSRRHFLLHVACPEGVRTCVHRLGLITPDEAQAYLVELTRDFLDAAQLDLLPFELIAGGPELRRVYDERSPSPVSAVDYVQILQEKLAQDRENFTKTLHIPRLVEMAGAHVPADALAKVQRRFRLLDRGPAQLRWHGRRPAGGMSPRTERT